MDAVITQGMSMVVDTKALAGESGAKRSEGGDRLYSGSININGVLEAQVSRYTGLHPGFWNWWRMPTIKAP